MFCTKMRRSGACSLFTFRAGVRYGTHDLFNLVDSGSPRKQSFTQQHLSQNAAKAPHVHTFGVPLDKRYSLITDLKKQQQPKLHQLLQFRQQMLIIPRGSQQNLWSSVPPSGHILRQRWITAVLLELFK